MHKKSPTQAIAPILVGAAHQSGECTPLPNAPRRRVHHRCVHKSAKSCADTRLLRSGRRFKMTWPGRIR